MEEKDGIILTPHFIEQTLLGAIVTKNDILYDVTSKIKPEFFSSDLHKIIFKEMMLLGSDGDKFDIFILGSRLKKHNGHFGVQDIEGYLLGCQGAMIPGKVEPLKCLSWYVDKVVDGYRARSLYNLATDILFRMKSGDCQSVEDMIAYAENLLLSMRVEHTTGETGLVNIVEYASKVSDMLHQELGEDGLSGLGTGLKGLDRLTSGLQPETLVVIGARSGMGKTSLGLNIAMSAIYKHKKVAFFTLEMTKASLLQRLYSSMGDIPHQDFLNRTITSEQYKIMGEVNEILLHKDGGKLFISDTFPLSPFALGSEARAFKRIVGSLDLIVVDYIQSMKYPRYSLPGNKTEEIGEISKALKQLAKQFKIPIIALSQLNRNVEGRVNGRPIMSDLRDSGSIEQDADLIIFIHQDKNDDDTYYNREIIIGKNRSGETGEFKCRLNGSMSRFEE